MNMQTATTQKKPTLRKYTDHLSEEDESDFYSEDEYEPRDEDKSDASHLSRSNTSYIMTSETESIERDDASAEDDDSGAPTTEIIRKETSIALPEAKGLAPIQPIGDRRRADQVIEKDPASALSLRLDLNLDIEIELKAKIRGDLTLSLLFVLHYYHHICGRTKLIFYRT